MDMPSMHIDFLEIPHKIGPFGAKGIGEGALLPTAPAIVNAVCQAIRAPINAVPITSEKVFMVINGRDF